MSMPNPFVPAGSLIAERQRRHRSQFKIGVYAVLAAHLTLLLGLLIEGCKSDEVASPAGVQGRSDSRSGQSGPGVAVTPQRADKPALPSRPVPPRVAAAIPDVPAAPSAATVKPEAPANVDLFYVVKSGDTLPHIAGAHGTTVEAIKAANGLKGNRLAVGRSLKLPAGARTTLASAAGN